MIRFTRWAVGLVAFSASVSAFAQEEGPIAEPAPEATTAPVSESSGSASIASDGGGDEKKFKLGLRLGYAVPFGESFKGTTLSDGISGQIPIWVDAGYMVTPNVLLGVYVQYGFLQLKNCPDSCSGHDLRFGIQGQYHLSPEASLDPWFGLGVGYEIAGTSQSTQGFSVDSSVKGLEFLNLQAGADFKVADAFSVGPFLSLSLGQYSSAKFNDQDVPVGDKAIHEWFTFGAKGTFGL
ncbi:MAG: hypothetical protein ABW061_14255 [Polyangiaceae bacterium]